jgi:hypothetical protein
MRSRIILLAIIISIIPYLPGCTGSVKGPGIVISNSTFNFGDVEEGALVNHAFDFTNNGTETLIIENVQPTCGCTVAGDYDKEIKPGAHGKIPLSLNTKGYDGAVKKTIHVKTNVTDKSDVIVMLEGKVKMSIALEPRSLFLGNIERKKEEPKTGKITIKNNLPKPIKITEIIPPRDSVKATLDTVKPGFEYSLNITVNPPFTDGQNMENVILKTDNKQKPEISAPFSYYYEPIVRVFPNPLYLSAEQLTKGSEQTINIDGAVDANIKVVNISVSDPKVKSELKEITKGTKYTLVLTVPAGYALENENNKNLKVSFKIKNIPNEPEFVVQVYKM